MLFKLILNFIFCLSSITIAEQPSYITFPSDISWKSQESSHFTAVFRSGKEDLALKVLSAAEKAHRTLAPIFPEGPEKTWIVVADFKDSLNGYALNFPYSHIVFFAAPPTAGNQLASLDDWIYSVILHEYVHILHIYPASGLWKTLRTVFGTWVVPNGMMPSHLHEGLATFFETEKTQGGRGRSAIFSMYSRMAVEEKVWGNSFAPLDLLDGSSTRWPFGASPYFFGYELYKELWERKGQKGIYDLTLAYSSNWPYFINTPLEEVFKTDYPTMWNSIYETEKTKVEAEISEIKNTQLSKLDYLTSNRLFKAGVTFSPDKKKVAYVADSLDEMSGLYILDLATQKTERVTGINDASFSNLCWLGKDDSEKIVFISPSNKFGYAVNELISFNLKTKSSLSLTIEGTPIAHVHSLACSDTENKLVIYTDESDKGQVMELTSLTQSPDDQGKFKLVRKWNVPERQWVTGLWTGKTSGFGLKEQMRTHIYQWNSEGAPQKTATLLNEFFNFKPSQNPNNLEAISDLNGRHEIWEIDLKNKTVKQKGGFLGGINSFDKKDNQYLVSSYRHGGYDIAWATDIESEELSLPKLENSTPLPEKLDSIEPPKDYSPLSTLRPHTWVPSLLFVPDGAQIGAWIPGFDLTQKHLYDIFAGYDTRGLPFANLLYTHRFAKSSSFYSGVNFSPSYLRVTKSFFKRWGGRIGFGQELPWGFPLVNIGLIFSRLESSYLGPAEQSIGLQIFLSKTWGLASKKGAVSPSNGIKTSIAHTQYLRSLGSDKDFFTTVASLSANVDAPWASNHTFYIANQLGYTEGSSFINSYFEGGGELLFSQGRGFFLNRGFLPSLFAGRRMFASNLEYRFPIKTIERGYHLLPLFLRSIHGALVADTLSYDRGIASPLPKDLFKKFYTSFGVELKSDWKLLFYLPTQVRLGAYHGFGPLGENLYFTLGVEAGI
jgi:hypothetical protein